MKELLLRTKAWKYFIVVFIIPQIASQFLISNYVTSIAEGGADFNPDTFILRMSVFMVISLVCAIPFYLWMWAVGNELPRYIPEDLRVHPGFFNIALVSGFLLSSLSSFSLVIGIKKIVNHLKEIIGSNFDLENFDPDMFDPSEFLVMFSYLKFPIILMVIGLIFTLYCYYFSAKTISKARLQSKPGFGDNFVNFILHFVFFGSIWYFQPEIKKVMAKYGDQDKFDNDITDIDDLV